MKIAIIGGGAAGMASAYYLNKAGHEVSIYEKQPILGGHIRTLNKNVECNFSKDIILEAGVLEFPDKFHHFFALLNELEVEIKPVNAGTALFFKNGERILSKKLIRKNAKGFQVIKEKLKLESTKLSVIDVFWKNLMIDVDELPNQSMGYFLKENKAGHQWFQNLIMYCYSMPFKDVANIPSLIGIPAILDYRTCQWFRIEGGAYTYIEKIIEKFKGNIFLNSKIESIYRKNERIEILTDVKRTYDKLILAVSPGQVLNLLDDADNQEISFFENWKDLTSQTSIHTDSEIYKAYNIIEPSEFDFFETKDGWGYNAYLNDLCGINSSKKYYLSYNLQSILDSSKIIHTQKHLVPFYQSESFKTRSGIMANNGHNNTYFTGAYLGDGLHEGAISSAVKVVELIAKFQ